jgi:hypothetical protein
MCVCGGMGRGGDKTWAYEGVLMIQAADGRKKAERGWFHCFLVDRRRCPVWGKSENWELGWMTKRFSVTRAFSGAMAAPMFTECVDVAGE